MKLFGIIYKHTNKANGKIYVGQTIQGKNPNRRFRKGSYRAYKGSTAFHKALVKHTWEGFETEIIYSAFDQDALNRAEEYFIKFYDCALPKGYNSVTIVEGNIEYTEEVRNKISAAQKKRYSEMEVIPEAINKKQHIILEGVPHKNCPKCNETKTLENFGDNSARWDNLHTYCRPCSRIQSYRPYVRMSPEDKRASIENKKALCSEKILEAYANKPHLKVDQAKRKSKPVIGTHIETGVEIEFSSALEAKNFGFDNTNLGQAIKLNKPYKKHTWRFK